MTDETRSTLAARANALAAPSRAPGAPTLAAGSLREAVIAWLQWNDPNGSHTDALAAGGGFEPYTDESAWEALGEMIE